MYCASAALTTYDLYAHSYEVRNDIYMVCVSKKMLMVYDYL